MNIPASIKRHIGFRKGMLDKIGCSEAQVLMFDDLVLKIQPESNAAGNEHQMTRWLQGRMPVPQIVEEAHVDGFRYLLMTRMPGCNLCGDAILDDQELLAELMAEGLRQMWAVDISTCPADRSTDQIFREIEEGIRNGSITMDTARQEETYGPSGFASPAQLFDWLVKHRPDEQLVLSHGDYCLPNVMTDGKAFTGLIDLGYSGIADKWVDIEKGLWSMWANTTGIFGGKRREFDRKYLFQALNMQPDDDKLRFYSLLSELC